MTRSLASFENSKAPAARMKHTKKVVQSPRPLYNLVLFLRSYMETKSPSSMLTDSLSFDLRSLGLVSNSQITPLA